MLLLENLRACDVPDASVPVHGEVARGSSVPTSKRTVEPVSANGTHELHESLPFGQQHRVAASRLDFHHLLEDRHPFVETDEYVGTSFEKRPSRCGVLPSIGD